MDEITGVPDLDDVAEVMNAAGAMGEGAGKLLEGIDKVMGGRFVAHRAKQEQKAAKSKRDFAIEMLQDAGVDISSEQKLGITLLAMKEMTGFENLEEVISRVAIPDGAEPQAIEDEWMARWVEGSKEAFSEWRRVIMADAARAKSIDATSISMAALDCIARMERCDIETLRRIAGLCPTGDDDGWGPMILSDDDSILGLAGLRQQDIGRLCGIGVIERLAERKQREIAPRSWIRRREFSNDRPYDGDGKPIVITIDFPGTSIDVKPAYYATSLVFGVKTRMFIDYGAYNLTEAGRQLCSLLSPIAPNDAKGYIDAAYARVAAEEREALEESQPSEHQLGRAMSEIQRKLDHSIAF